MNAASRAPARARVFIVDDHPIVRQGMALLINSQPDLVVCGEAQDGRTAVEALFAAQADLVIADISLTGPDGLDLVKAVRERSATIPVLILSMHDEAMYAERALRAGANGYIMKQEATDRVLAAIRRVLKGDVYLSPRASSRMVQRYVRGAPARPGISVLSNRELEVFRLIGEGHSTRHIATQLRLSVKTIETYQAHIKDKLSLHSARELVQHAIEWHLIPATRDATP